MQTRKPEKKKGPKHRQQAQPAETAPAADDATSTVQSATQLQQEVGQAQLEESLKRRTIEVECGPVSAEGTEPWRSSIERLKQRFRVSRAADLHPNLAFADKGQSWPSPGWGVVTPDVLEKLQRARAALIVMGFRVDADPVNDLGDGKSWTLICERTDNVPNVPDLADLVDRRLQSEGLPVATKPFWDKGEPVATKPFWDKGELLVDLWDSGQASRARPTSSGREDAALVEGQAAAGPLFPNDKDRASRQRAQLVAKAIEELQTLKAEAEFELPEDFDTARRKFPNFFVLSATTPPGLRDKILSVKSARAIGLAQYIVSVRENKKFSTILKDWKKHKPSEFRRKPQDGWA